MIIANPIYDVVFKRMMENDRVAKFFIGTLLNQTVLTVEVKPQEFTYEDQKDRLSIFRLDFIATIVTETGETRKILIEIQKTRNHVDLMRFRNYLAEQYKKEDKVNDKSTALPITTIYLLGFRLPELSSACIQVERHYKDLINKTIIESKSEFVEKLTHDCFIVQVDRITERYQTKLDKLLSVFEQNHFIDSTKIIKEFTHSADGDEDIKIMTDLLHYTGINAEERALIEKEQEAWRTVNAMEQALRDEIETKNKVINEKDQVINEKENLLTLKNQVITEKDQVINEKENLLSEKDKALEEMAKQLEALKKMLGES